MDTGARGEYAGEHVTFERIGPGRSLPSDPISALDRYEAAVAELYGE